MNLSTDFLAIVLFGVASVAAALVGAFATRGWRSKLLWVLAILFLALTVVWLRWPALSPILTALWRSNALVVLAPVVLVLLVRQPGAPKPPPPPFPIAPVIVRPKPRFRQPFGGRAAEAQASAKSASPTAAPEPNTSK